MSSKVKIGVLLVVVVCVLLRIGNVAMGPKSSSQKKITFTEFIGDVEAGKVRRVSIANGVEVVGNYKDNSPDLYTLIPASYTEIYTILNNHGVNVEIMKASGASWVSVLINASPFLLLLAFWVFMMRRMKGGRPRGTE